MKKLLAVAALGENIYGRWLFHRLLSKILLLAGLTIMAAVLIASLLLCALYAAYLALLDQGVTQWMAGSFCFVLGIAIIVSIVWVIRRCLAEFNKAPQSFLKQTISIAQAFPAFWAGFTETPKK